MKIKYGVSTCLMMAALGCNNKAATKSNLKDGLNHIYARLTTCPNYTASNFPMDVPPNYKRSDLDALAGVGLLTKTTGVTNASGATVTQYDLTKKGRETAFSGKDPLRQGEPLLFCFGDMRVDEVTNFTEPAEVDGLHVTRVTYTVKMTNVPSWTKDPAVQKVFPGLTPEIMAKQAKRADGMMLTSEGWRRRDDQ